MGKSFEKITISYVASYRTVSYKTKDNKTLSNLKNWKVYNIEYESIIQKQYLVIEMSKGRKNNVVISENCQTSIFRGRLIIVYYEITSL